MSGLFFCTGSKTLLAYSACGREEACCTSPRALAKHGLVGLALQSIHTGLETYCFYLSRVHRRAVLKSRQTDRQTCWQGA